MKARSQHFVAALAVVALVAASNASASGGIYGIDGGTRAERAQIPSALNASSFNWSAVDTRIHFHIARGIGSYSTPGEIWLDANLLDAGRFAWGVIQHEYGHQVDFFLLTASDRAELLPLLGGRAWWDPPGVRLRHDQLAGERFASTLAWSFWPSPENSMRPQSPRDESAAMAPARFRLLMQRTLKQPAATSAAKAPPRRTQPPALHNDRHLGMNK